jgi:DNA (cytosine-5)-methyltransferase 1
VALHPRTCLSLFSGAAGLDLGLRRAIPGLRTVGYVEREAYAAATLVARMEDEALDNAPVWDDVATFDGEPFRGVVDLVAGGFPCQDISNAGKRAGIGGGRSGLWREFARIVDETSPEWVFVENVSALRTRGLDVVLGDLAAMGFDAEWGCFRASEAGAPHRRERMFILAHARGHGLWQQPGRGYGPQRSGPAESEFTGYDLGDSNVAGLEGRGLSDGGRPDERVAGEAGREMVHTPSLRRPQRRPEPEGLERGTSAPESSPPCEWPPGPDDREGWRRVLEVRPDLEPAVRRVADGLANRVDRLRLCGNGVVPHQAELAWKTLYRRIVG